MLSLYHSIRHPSQRQYPAWSADSRPRTPLDRIYNFVFDGSTRYIVPSLLLSISSFLVSIKSSALKSTYICPIANSSATTIPSLQFFSFLLDCIIVQISYRLVDDGISPVDDWTIHLQDGTSNHLLVGLTLIVRCHHPACCLYTNTHRHLLWSFSLLASLYTLQCQSIASGCSSFLLNIS